MAEGAARAEETRIVQFRSDGLGLSPGAYARLLAEIAERSGIAADDYSRGGVVAELETRMAALLGKEAAVFLPTGTLANHLAVRRLARHGRRVLVQRESHLWNDEGDCVQHLSGLTLGETAGLQSAISLKQFSACDALPALVTIIGASWRRWDYRSHSYLLFPSLPLSS